MFGVVIAFFLCSSHPLSDAQKVERAVEKALKKGFPLELVAEGVHIEEIEGQNFYIMKAIADFMLDNGVKVYRDGKTGVPVLKYLVERLSVSYRPVFSLPFKRKYRREVSFSISLVLEKDNEIIWTGRVEGKEADRLGESQLGLVKSRGLSPDEPPKTSDILESILVSALVGFIIVGLYTGGK